MLRSGDTGHDILGDFTAGAASEDLIEFATDLFMSFSEVIAAASDDGVHITIAIYTETSVTLQNVAVADLHQDDFMFV